MSLFGGGALFENLHLDLGVLEAEFSLPYKFLRGHIQALRISIPWTKVTSEPIQVHVQSVGKAG